MLEEFAHPYVGNFVALYSYVADKLFYALIDRVVEDNPQSILRNLGSPRLDGAGWQPAMGFIRGAWRDDPQWADAQLAILAHGAGLLDSFEARTECASQPLFLGGMALPPSSYEITAEMSVIRVKDLTRREEIEFRRTDGGVLLHRPEDLVLLLDEHPLVHSRGDWLLYRAPEDAMGALSADRHASVVAVDEMLCSLKRYAPEYLLWILLPLKEITFLEPLESLATQSRSSPIFPGNIQITSPAKLPRMVAQLAHECSHQFFHLAQWLGPVVAQDAPKAYSILKNTERPLDRVLLGYHAFANIYLALHALKEGGISGKGIDDEILHTREGVEQLGSQLEANVSFLTEVGEELYIPLRDRVASIVA